MEMLSGASLGRRTEGSSQPQGRDNTAKLWDADTGREVLNLPGRQTGDLAVAWSPDGKRLALAGSDGIAQVFVIDSIELLRLVRSRISRDLTTDECRRYLNTDHCP